MNPFCVACFKNPSMSSDTSRDADADAVAAVRQDNRKAKEKEMRREVVK